MSESPIAEAFALAVDYALTQGAENINELPGCWEADVDEHWWIAINGHKEPAQSSKGVEVAPFHWYVMLNDWPAGVIHPYGGEVIGGVSNNEDAFIEALQAAIAKFHAPGQTREQKA